MVLEIFLLVSQLRLNWGGGEQLCRKFKTYPGGAASGAEVCL